MAADSIVSGLFATPEQYQQAQNQQALANAVTMAQLTPQQQANAQLQYAGYLGGQGLGSALGAQDPMLQMQSARQAILKGVDQTSATSLRDAAQKLADLGDLQGANALAQQSVNIQSKVDEKQAARDVQLQIAREKLAADLQRAREHGATQLQIAQMANEGRQQLALLAQSLKQNAPLSTADLKLVAETKGNVNTYNTQIDEANKFIDLIDKGELKFGAAENAGSYLRSLGGAANQSDINKAQFEQWVQGATNAILLKAKGTQTEGDAKRAQAQIVSGLSKNDPKLVSSGLAEFKKLLEAQKKTDVETLNLISKERNRPDMAAQGTASNPIVLK